MMEVSQQHAKTMLAIHGWSGILLGALLYLVIVTGVVAVFAEEINDWASPLQHSAPHKWPVGLDAKLRELAATVKPEYQEELTMFARAGGRLRVFFHHHIPVEGEAFPQEYGAKFDLHPETLEVLDRKEGWGDDIDEVDAPNALADFLVHLHISLHLPDPYGFFLTGVLGLAMLVAAVTGFVIHRHLLRELFTLRKYRKGLLVRRDTHVIAATWNLPFAFILAFTGSYFSFTSSVGFPALAMVAFGGDQVAMSETLNGSVAPENTAPATPADFDRILADTTTRAGAPNFIIVDHYGRADARVTIFTARPGRRAVRPQSGLRRQQRRVDTGKTVSRHAAVDRQQAIVADGAAALRRLRRPFLQRRLVRARICERIRDVVRNVVVDHAARGDPRMATHGARSHLPRLRIAACARADHMGLFHRPRPGTCCTGAADGGRILHCNHRGRHSDGAPARYGSIAAMVVGRPGHRIAGCAGAAVDRRRAGLGRGVVGRSASRAVDGHGVRDRRRVLHLDGIAQSRRRAARDGE